MKLNNNDLQSFEELPQGWAITTLGEILPLTYGKALKKETRDESGNVPVYGSSGQVGVHSNALTQKPALIVGRKGSVGEVYRSPVPCWPIDTVYFAEERDDGDLKYFEYLLKGLKLSKLDKSTAVPGLSRDDYNAVEVAIAPLDQQKRIVAEIEKQFSRLDEAVANLKRVKANLKRYKAAVLKTAVEGNLVETEAELARREGRSYETGGQLLQRILETRRIQWQGKGKYKEPAAPDTTDLPELPEGWVWATVEQLACLVEYGSSAKTKEDPNGVPVLRMGNIVEGELRFDELKFLPANHNEFPKLLLKPSDLLFNRTNSPELVGKTAVYAGSPKVCSFASYLIRVRLVDGAVSNLLAAYINSSHGRNWVKSVVTQQVGQANVNGTKLQALSVPLPPETEQHRIVAEVDRRLSLLRETEAQVDADLQRAERLRQSILSKAFSA
ncbi:MAG: restriction endonuclease subunit S [Betaproteobacteria bacterium]|nr:restriction endonuclease subunit S [Betaproteobacteria bacterium]MDE2185853.1 restriction endonuclease subunit S [Betaproteobacteria bacterium]MDE2324448.1 restriction endonuclease subunit S [Betaproteobacteria bacterium]